MFVLHNAKIYTFDPSLPAASAIAVDHGRILAIGKDERLLAEFEGRAQMMDAGRRAVIPGLTDAHIHLQYYALGLKKVDCESRSRAECLARVAERAAHTPPGEWILGHGWNQNDWPEGFGSAADLDDAAPAHPVYLTAKSLHAGWANSAALRLAGIQPHSDDPEGGRIGRDDQGYPDGILYESAMALVSSVLPEPSLPQLSGAIAEAQERLWRMGLTGVHDFDRRACFTALQDLHMNHKLGLRVLKTIPIESLAEAVELGLRSGFGDDFLRIGQVKAFADGALGPRTAAMLQPYEGEPDNYGMCLLDAEEIFERGQQAVENGLALTIHAIGDRANHEVLNAYSQLRALEKDLLSSEASKGESGNSSPLRHRIEHVQVLHPDDAPRLAGLGLIASMQPTHATSDFPAADRYWGERSAYAYAWRTLLDFGTRVAFGSDAPVESPNPFYGLHAAVTRRRQDGSPGPDGWYPHQRLALNEAFFGFTGGAAYAAGMEDRLGKLATGYLADLLVLDTDPFTCHLDHLHEIRPLATMVGGEWVYLEDRLNDSLSTAGHPPHAP
jgi:predicted amidohydrolase YtcJ